MIRVVEWSLRHPRRVGALAVLLLLLAVVGLTRGGTSAAVSTITGTGSAAYQADRASAKAFGDEAIVVLIRSSARDITLTDDVGRVLGLEACLGGKVPEEQELPGGKDGPCEALRRLDPVHVVYGPATFIGTGVDLVNGEIARAAQNAQTAPAQAKADAEAAARKAGRSAAQVAAAGRAAERAANDDTSAALQVAQSYGVNPTGVRITDTPFVSRFVFGGEAADLRTPKALFRPVLPSPDAGLIAVRLRHDLGDDARRRVVGLVRDAVALPEFRLARGSGYVVSGTPVIVGAVADELQGALLALLAVGVLVMAVVLALTFPERRRLRPLLLALGTVGVVFGAIGLLGLSLNLGTIATLPVLLGLAVDYGVQLHARVEESRRAGLDGPEAVRDAVRRGGRPVLLAAGATLAGFVALFASPTPLVRGFALVLFVGVALAVLASFTIGLVLHAGLGRRGRATDDPDPAHGGEGAGADDDAATPGAPPADAPVVATGSAPALATGGIGSGPVVRRLVSGAHARPWPVLVVGTLLAVVGVAVGSTEAVETDIQRLVPGDLPALRDARALEAATGQSGEVRVLVRGRDLATPKTLAWIDDTRTRVLRDAGYDAARGCTDGAALCPLSAPFSTLMLTSPPKTLKTAEQAEAALAALPTYFTESAITEDRSQALISLGLPLAPLDEQQRTLDRVRSAVANPPAGVTATVTGLPVLVGDASAAVSSPLRRLLTLLGSIVLVGGLLVAVTRSWRRGLVPVLPVALAAGWSGVLTWALGLPLNPLSVVLSALIVAIGTEFGVLLVERYGQERRAGHPDAVAIARTAASTGRAVGASAATTVAGFGVLAVSDIPLLRQFGLITVLDLGVAVLAVVVVLPAVAAVAARRAAAGTPEAAPAASGAGTVAPPAPAREELRA
jgi:hydrophobe/amphiphile efflux-3 (HAE3) family protein